MRNLFIQKHFFSILFFLCFASWVYGQHSKLTTLKTQDPFRRYLKVVPPVVRVLSESRYTKEDSAITVKKFTFAARDAMDTVYAIMAYPAHIQGKRPGLIFLHGGGSRGEDMLGLVKSYAFNGYITLAFDLPGICNVSKTPYSSGKWKSRAAGEGPRLTAIDIGLENSTLVDAEVTAIEGFNYLCAQQNVDVANIGVTGFSWGGYSTTFISGILSRRVKAAYSVFGCGYYDKGSFWKSILDTMPRTLRKKWLTYFDAGRRAGNMHAAYFLEATSNDTYFWPEAVGNTLHAIREARNHVWDPGFNHRQMPVGLVMQRLYFDYYLKGIGKPFGTADIISRKKQKDGSRKIVIHTSVPAGVTIDSVVLYYSGNAENWQSRKWVSLKTVPEGADKYYVSIPPELLKKGSCYYGFVTDSRQVSVSTAMYRGIDGSEVL